MTAPQRHKPPQLPDFVERMLPANVERYCLKVDGSKSIHVMEQGEGRPVLLQHGNPTWGFLYRKVMEGLAGEPLRLIVPDLVGLGYSSRVKSRDHTLENHARWIGEVIDQLALDKLIVVGQDWGGPAALVPMAERSERLAGLVILNTVIGPPRPGFKPTAFHRFAAAPVISTAVFRLLGFPQVRLSMAQHDKASISGHVARAYRAPLRGWAQNAAPLALARMVPNGQDHPSIAPLQRSQQLVENFDGPAAIVWGKNDPILGRLLKRIQRALPQAETTVTEAGHFLQEEVPEPICAAIRSVAQQASEASA